MNCMDKCIFIPIMENELSFTCPCCGEVYELNLCFGNEYPYSYFSVPEDEIDKRVELTKSMCVIDEEHFFHRCRITIPIINRTESLIFNIWTSISEDNFVLRNDSWDDPARVNQGPYFGWLNNIIPTYGETLNIKTMAYENEVGFIPTLKVIEENHPLTYDQENGITFDEAIKKAQHIFDWHKK